MGVDNPLPTVEDDYGGVVTPVKRRSARDTEYEDGFSYSQVHIEDGVTDSLSDKARIVREGDTIFYRYQNKTPVMVKPDGVHAHEGYNAKDAEGQAFFVLSMLASEGYVSNWSKK